MPQKERITVSLSHASARFLRAFRSRSQSPSMSALFETIVADLQGKVEMEKLDEKITAYYDSLQEPLPEDYAWGMAGEAGLAAQVEEEQQHRPKPAMAGAAR